jgi:mediator of replication checkpoint protein 1
VLSVTLFVQVDAEHGNAEANADTRAFADTYNQSLKDDDQEFAYLEKESQLENHTNVGYKSHEDNEEEEEEEEEPQEYISPDEMRRLVRERAKDGVRLISLYSAFSHC